MHHNNGGYLFNGLQKTTPVSLFHLPSSSPSQGGRAGPGGGRGAGPLLPLTGGAPGWWCSAQRCRSSSSQLLAGGLQLDLEAAAGSAREGVRQPLSPPAPTHCPTNASLIWPTKYGQIKKIPTLHLINQGETHKLAALLNVRKTFFQARIFLGVQGIFERIKLTQPTQQPLTSNIAKDTTDPKVIMKVTVFRSYYKLNSFRISTKLCTGIR